ncbi:DUF177 domain-containing protein [Virgibacillus sp. MSJ-26]|uniref:YceD family protein n=1 Tax=Virgibacillus sp. MSJ-26 TaxID=2841522 RepID=UPI001C10BB48|nr:YceD family protein [Virgibacillus sp. MSJ-26]MBU5467751.1 DUF177 domain-containing protein [Virgibacillus sp. MSJ-26]
MKLTLGKIKRNAFEQPYIFEKKVDVSELEKMNNDIRKINPVDVKAMCTMQGEEIIITLNLKGEMILPCARTLVDVVYPFNITADEIYTLSPYYSEEDEEDEIHPVDGEVIDLTPQIKENILLDIPFRVFSDDENAQKNAPTKGEGWEIISEETDDQSIDPRMKKLEKLLKDKKEK